MKTSKAISDYDIKDFVFSLPLSQRIKLFNEIKETDIKKLVYEEYKKLCVLAKSKKNLSSKIDDIIQKVRKRTK